ncbi:MAG TPA: nucleotide exchange factor GrpE [Acidimicrobiales bacterium]|nr:nucleotide exchange factor GrpE [Acidimicrobiales bacterium]
MSDAEDWVPEAEPEAAPEEVVEEAAPSGDDVAADLEAFVDLAKERDDLRDQLLRTRADFENYRKRVTREMAEARDAGAASLAAKLVDVLDTVDLALAHDPSDSVAQIAGALFDALAKEGLTRIDALGTPFDPEVHDAVLHEEGDGPAEVIEVLRSGWKWTNGRVLRAAMVKVKGS